MLSRAKAIFSNKSTAPLDFADYIGMRFSGKPAEVLYSVDDLQTLNDPQNRVVCLDLRESRGLDLKNDFIRLTNLSNRVAFLILLLSEKQVSSIAGKPMSLRTRKNRKRSKLNLERFLKSIPISLPPFGFFKSRKLKLFYDSYILLFGSHVAALENPKPLKKIMAFMKVFNEIDIIPHSIDNLRSNGIEVTVFDNWSTDGTYELVKKMSENDNGISVFRYPEEGFPKEYNLHKYLLFITEKIKTLSNEWFIHMSADELRVSPIKNLTLQEYISIIDSLGYNTLDQTVIDFRPSKDGYDGSDHPFNFFRYLEFGQRPGHFSQMNIFKIQKGQDFNLADSGGHRVVFENQWIFPLKALLNHFPLRSTSHARRKIFKERLPRYAKSAQERGWHVQYKKYRQSNKFIWSKFRLIHMDQDLFDYDYFIERLSGVGLRKE